MMRSQQLLCTLLEELKLNYRARVNPHRINALIRGWISCMVPAELQQRLGPGPEDQSQSPPAGDERSELIRKGLRNQLPFSRDGRRGLARFHLLNGPLAPSAVASTHWC